MTFEFFPQPNIILQIGSVSLYFYGAMYALSGISAYYFTRYWVRKISLSGYTDEDILDILFWSFFLGVLGGRIGYMLIYNLDNFLVDPFSLFTVWNGGMSIHGGLIGGVLGFYILTRIKNVKFFQIADIATVSVAFGMALGRLGNFVNKELVGRVTDVSWAVDFGDGVMRHPSQLYAMGKDILLFCIFWYVLQKMSVYKWKEGYVFSAFLILYAIFRFCVEFFREPDSQLGFIFLDFSMGQVLSFLLLIVGIGIFTFLLYSQVSVKGKS